MREASKFVIDARTIHNPTYCHGLASLAEVEIFEDGQYMMNRLVLF